MKIPEQELSQPGALGREIKIVLVDDVPDVLNSLQLCLRHHFTNLRILKFTDGEQAWAELVREEPDYLISDMVRQGVDGVELLRRLAQRRVKYPILIHSSAVGNMETAAKLFARSELNISYLEKPCGMQKLVSTVKSGLGIT